MEKNEINKIVKNHIPFTGMINELIKSLLDSQEIKYHIVESRTKTPESLEEKVERKGIRDFKSEILDITGIRIILYYQDDIDKVQKLINENFQVDQLNSVNKENLYDSNEFGYLSRHYIVELNDKRNKLAEWKRFKKYYAEIQVRTVLQHSWASISHELSYKKNYDIPKEVSRKLFRLASLFELADEQFLEIRDKHLDLETEINKLNIEELSAENINMLTLKHNLNLTTGIFEDIKKSAIEGGFKYTESDLVERYLSGIILISDYLDVSTIGEMERLLEKNKESYKLVFHNMISINDSSHWSGPKEFFVMIAMLFSLNETQLIKFSEERDWKNSLWEATFKAINKVKQ